jgi:DNA-binding transcriptional MerR regulator
MTKLVKASLAERLGASQVEKLPGRPTKSPLGLLRLQKDIENRLKSSGGRPTDPSWTVTRQVPFKAETWEELKSAAEKLGNRGRRVGPAQIAAILVERSLGESQSSEWNSILDASRSIGVFGAPEAADAAGVTYSQFDHWVHSGRITVKERLGRLRKFDSDEVVRARVLRHLAQIGFPIGEAAQQLRDVSLSPRFVVTRIDERSLRIHTANSLEGLVDEATVVIDQDPIRRMLLVKFSDGAYSANSKDEDDERRLHTAEAI